MTFLVDTNVLAELRKGARANVGVQRWFREADERHLLTSVLVVGEVRRGIESVRRRDPTAALALDHWLARLTGSFGDRILTVDARVAETWGRLSVPDPIPAVDGLLAATALVHDLTLVTRNVRDVARTGARVVDPFA